MATGITLLAVVPLVVRPCIGESQHNEITSRLDRDRLVFTAAGGGWLRWIMFMNRQRRRGQDEPIRRKARKAPTRGSKQNG